MEKLELQEMENLKGGSINCGIAAVGAIGFGLAVATIAFPLSALAYAGWIASGAALGGSIGSCLYELNH